MNFPETHPIWMWLYFGVFGSVGAILITLVQSGADVHTIR